MSEAKLIRMANDIATFFRSYPHDAAVTGIHDHIRAFWTPKMRAALTADAAGGAAGLDSLVAEAMLGAIHARSPTATEVAGPDEVGEIGASDAG